MNVPQEGMVPSRSMKPHDDDAMMSSIWRYGNDEGRASPENEAWSGAQRIFSDRGREEAGAWGALGDVCGRISAEARREEWPGGSDETGRKAGERNSRKVGPKMAAFFRTADCGARKNADRPAAGE